MSTIRIYPTEYIQIMVQQYEKLYSYVNEERYIDIDIETTAGTFAKPFNIGQTWPPDHILRWRVKTHWLGEWGENKALNEYFDRCYRNHANTKRNKENFWTVDGITKWRRNWGMKGINLGLSNFFRSNPQEGDDFVSFMLGDTKVIIEAPLFIKYNENGNIHAVDGPAIKWADGFALYAINGNPAPKINEKYGLRTVDIVKIKNQTVKRDAIQVYGDEKFIKDQVENDGMELIAQNEYGKIWRRDPMGVEREQFAVIQVQNSTQNENGEYDVYFIRIPPDIDDPREAIGWTFSDPDYTIEAQS